MKKLIIFYIIALIVLMACSPNPDNGSGDKAGSDSLQDFKNYIAVAEEPEEVEKYLDELMKKADTKTADALVQEYLDYMEDCLSADHSDPASFPQDAGFKFVSGEGEDYPVIDYRFLDAYSGQVFQETTDFAKFMALNSDKPWAVDGGIIIPIKDLADRIARGEQFITGYPNSAIKDEVQEQYSSIYLQRV